MDFVGGNLDEFLYPEKYVPGGGGEADKKPRVPPEVHYNPNMKFGPLPGEFPYFRLTVATPRLSVSRRLAAAGAGCLLDGGLAAQGWYGAHGVLCPASHVLRSWLAHVQLTFEAHPREWQDACPAYLYAGHGEILQLKPFMRAQVGASSSQAGHTIGVQSCHSAVSVYLVLPFWLACSLDPSWS
jgi:hypothetical protein